MRRTGSWFGPAIAKGNRTQPPQLEVDDKGDVVPSGFLEASNGRGVRVPHPGIHRLKTVAFQLADSEACKQGRKPATAVRIKRDQVDQNGLAIGRLAKVIRSKSLVVPDPGHTNNDICVENGESIGIVATVSRAVSNSRNRAVLYVRLSNASQNVWGGRRRGDCIDFTQVDPVNPL